MEKRQSFDINPKAIWVTNLPYHTPESEIREVFEKYGKIVKIDSHDNGHRPYTFVHYETEEAAREAIEKSEGLEMGGRPIVVKPASKDRNEGRRDRDRDRDRDLDDPRRGQARRPPPRRDDYDRARWPPYDYYRRDPRPRPRYDYDDDRRGYPAPYDDYVRRDERRDDRYWRDDRRDDRYWRDEYRPRYPSPRDRSPPYPSPRDRSPPYPRDMSPVRSPYSPDKFRSMDRR